MAILVQLSTNSCAMIARPIFHSLKFCSCYTLLLVFVKRNKRLSITCRKAIYSWKFVVRFLLDLKGKFERRQIRVALSCGLLISWTGNLLTSGSSVPSKWESVLLPCDPCLVNSTKKIR